MITTKSTNSLNEIHCVARNSSRLNNIICDDEEAGRLVLRYSLFIQSEQFLGIGIFN